MVTLGLAFYFVFKGEAVVDTSSEFKTVQLEKGDIVVSVTGTGQVYALSQVDLNPVKAGDGIDVVSVNVKNDQFIKKNQIIAVLDTRDASKSVRDAQLSLDSANLRYEQIKDDYEDDKATSDDKKQQKITIQQKENALSDAKESLADYYIKAPFDGIVTGLSVQAGDSVENSDVIATVITQKKYAKISLNEVDAVKVKSGNKAILTFDALSDFTIKGEVTKVDTIGQVSQGVVSYDVEISFDYDSENLKPGMSVDAEIITDSKEDVLIAPSSAVKLQGDKYYVQVVRVSGQKEDSQGESKVSFAKKNVEIGITDDVSVEIISGVDLGERIVTQLPKSATTGVEKESKGLLDSIRIPGMGGGGGGR